MLLWVPKYRNLIFIILNNVPKYKFIREVNDYKTETIKRTGQKLYKMYNYALVRVTAFVKGLALLHFQGLLKQMQDSLTTRRTKAIQEKKFDLL